VIRRFARPYAKAMMEITVTAEKAQPVWDELAGFERTRKSSAELSGVLANPGIEPDKKLAVVRALGKKMGLSDLSLKFLEVLLRNHRLNDLGMILDAWRHIIHQALGIVVAHVRTAHDLDAAEQSALRSRLEKKLGRTIELQLSTDPSLLAGFVAQVGSEIFDASVNGRIERLRHTIL
jgi:F-type H+-transporting ATPase subunit delta